MKKESDGRQSRLHCFVCQIGTNIMLLILPCRWHWCSWRLYTATRYFQYVILSVSRRIPWKGTLWKIDSILRPTTDVHKVSVPGDVSTVLRSAQHDRQRRFSIFVFNVCSLLIVIGFAMHIVISRLPTLRTNQQNRFHRRCCTFGRRSRILLQL